MRFLRDTPLRRKLTLISMVTSCAALLLTCGIVVVYEYLHARTALVEEVRITAHMVGDNCASALLFDDPESAAQTLRSLDADPHLVAAIIYDAHGKQFSTFQLPGEVPVVPGGVARSFHRFSHDSLEVFSEISMAGDSIGTVYLRHDLVELRGNLARSAVLICGAIVLASIVAYLLSRRLQGLVAEPIILLEEVVRDVAANKNFSVRAIKHGNDEVGRLIDGFNRMLEQVEQRDSALQSAQDELERRVEERTAELALSVSLLNATLDSTADGILAIRLNGEVICYNSQFVTMWDVPAGILEKRQGMPLAKFLGSRVRPPEVGGGYNPEGEDSPEIVELLDGRFFETSVLPKHRAGNVVGVVISFRDITVRKRAAEALRKEQELLAALFENVADGIVSCDADGVLTLFNRATREMHGMPLTPVPADQWAEHFDLYLPDGETLMTKEQTPLFRALSDGSVRDMEVVIAPKHGPARRVVASGQAFFDARGIKVGAVVAMHDITERRRDEEKLRESHEKFSQLADNISDAFWIRSPDFHAVHYISDGYEQSWGRPAIDLYANPQLWAETILTEDRQRFFAVMSALCLGEPEVSLEYRIVRPDGSIRWVYDRGFQVCDAAGKLVRLTGIASDVTERKRAEVELDNVHKQLVETSRQAGMAEVATGVLHNVGNVLNSVSVSATLVADGLRKSKVSNLRRIVDLLEKHAGHLDHFVKNDAQGKELPEFLCLLHERLAGEQQGAIAEVELLRKNIEHIKSIVSMQQDYARRSDVPETLLVTELVEDSLRMNASALARHNITVEHDFEDLPLVCLDRHKTLQILVNLIQNAKHACDEGDADEKRIRVCVFAKGPRVRISVSDNGVGIPAENLVRIFNHGFTTRKNGHGFGLHSGALTAREMGGLIFVESEGVGQGATFTLELPLQMSTHMGERRSHPMENTENAALSMESVSG